jgi:glyoxylase-like metal-dependent hydrolase (beta-lactamase superfamily II)
MSIKEIMPCIYQLAIPLPGSPLKATNSYVVTSSERNLIIDTGWNKDECKNAMMAGLKKLGVDLRNTDFFITHLHADHIGLLPHLTSDTSTVYFNRLDAELMGVSSRWEQFLTFARMNGFPEAELQPALNSHPGYTLGLRDYQPTFTFPGEGDVLSVGDYRFTCVATPGHTRGHMCLYEPHRKVLFAGDHILIDITPNITLWTNTLNPLRDYLASLDKVAAMDIELVLPGHRRIITDCTKRIEELHDHHQKRVQEVLAILESGTRNAFRVASQMTWDIVCESWDQFPFGQKWFATGEAIAHLKYLEEQELIHREMQGQFIVFSLN